MPSMWSSACRRPATRPTWSAACATAAEPGAQDFDVATSATPEQVRAEFRNARVIGRRFAGPRAFRPRDHRDRDLPCQSPPGCRRGRQQPVLAQRERPHPAGQRLRQPGRRRAAPRLHHERPYYDPVTERILDYAHGVHDIRNRLIRLIGDPEQRYLEDRCACFAPCASPPSSTSRSRNTAPPPSAAWRRCCATSRLRACSTRSSLFLGGKAERTFELLLEYDLFAPVPGRCGVPGTRP